MNREHATAVRQRLLDRLAELQAQQNTATTAAESVSLDQSKVGRLSRIDALQGQAMAQATLARRRAALKAVQAALSRLDAGQYGQCEECGDAIDPRRLSHDPSVALCIECARLAESG